MQLKLPHWADLAIGLLTIVITWVVQQNASGALVLPALAITILTLASSVLTMISPSISTNINAKAVAARVIPPAACLCLVFWVACIPPKDPIAQTSDFTQAEQCIVQHWGEPIAQLAGECAKNEIAVVEDLVADIEALFELGAQRAGADPGHIRSSFPYAQLTHKVVERLAASSHQ